MGMEGARKNFVSATEMVQASGENSETLVYSPEEETRSVLKRVDQGTLKAIFDKMRVRSGTTEESDFVPFSKIQIDPTWCDMGRQDRTGIIINPVLIVETLGGTREDFRTFLLRTLIHEETHASAKNLDCTGPIKSWIVKRLSDFQGKEKFLDSSGYEHKSYKENIHGLETFDKKTAPAYLSERTDFRAFNEGVTERIAREVFDEYLRRTGDGMFFTNSAGKIASPFGYEKDVEYVELFIETLAYVSDFSPEQTWEAIKAGYMSGLDLGSTELKEFFETTFGPYVMTQLKDVKLLSPETFAENLPHLPITKDQRQRITATISEMNERKAKKSGISAST